MKKKRRFSENPEFTNLLAIMDSLLGEKGCSWDKKQNHRSLIKYLKEESDEVERAIKKGDWENLKEELGDLLLQVVFHSALAEKEGLFSVKDVVKGINSKLVRRHPHVFAGAKASTPREVLKRWKEIKAEEKGIRSPCRKRRGHER